MREYSFDAAVIGGGAAGMACGLEIHGNGFSTVIIEREEQLGGILVQCIHNGFGLHEFKEQLTGPEYAERFSKMIMETDIEVFLNATVMEITSLGEYKVVLCYSAVHGVFRLTVRSLVLAMGSRERNRGNVGIPGTRPAGIFTAGLAQRLVNIEGYIPGKDVVIVGSGDIGLIMARRMEWAGCKVHAVVEIQPYPSGITRNIVQCLEDFDIPLYLSHIISKIHGKDRVEKVEVTPLIEGIPDSSASFEIPCDTLLLSVGLVPENELSKEIGVRINPQTNGPTVDSRMMSSVEGVFACGNVLHVHDLVDFVTEESRRTGTYVADYLKKKSPGDQIRIKAGSNVRYVSPGKFNIRGDNTLYLRTMIVKNNAGLEIKLDHKVIKKIKKTHIQPSEMISLVLDRKDLESQPRHEDSVLEVNIV